MIKHTMRLPKFGLGTHQNIFGVEVYRDDADQVTVVLSEVAEAGTSIANAIDHVATDVVRGLVEQGFVRDPAKAN
jgi:hypothetical protein